MTTVEYILKLRDQFSSTIGKGTKSMQGLDKSVTKTDKAFKSLKRGIISFASIAVVDNIVKTTASMEGFRNAINFASGGNIEGGKTFEFLRSTSEDLGISLKGSIEGFKTFSSSVLGTGLGLEQTKDIFGDVSVAVSSMNLDVDRTKLVFLALGQIMSKGVVSAEELRRQLGDSLPGAMSIAARSMNKTVPEFDKLLSQGKILSKDFLPGFADEVRKTFSGGLAASTQSLRANINRFSNSLLEAKVVLGTMFLPVITKVLKFTTKLLKGFEGLTSFIAQNKDIFLALSATLGIFATYAAMVAIKNGILTFSFGLLSKSMLLTGKALLFLTSPIGVVVATFAVLAGLFVLLWRRSDKFRGVIVGLWESMKALGKGIKDYVVKRFRELLSVIPQMARSLKNLFTGKFGAAAKEAKGAFTSLIGVDSAKGALQSGKKVGESFREGYEKGVGVEPIEIKAIAKLKIEELPNFTSLGITGGLPKSVEDVALDKPDSVKKSNDITARAPKIFNINIDSQNFNIDAMLTDSKESFERFKQQFLRATNESLADLQLAVR